ncbi:hypothetical protein Back11_14660 [Paenibacillus baekrokdamisoli]|uniref:Uncharacterized protein n=1 Tax=Paenibacillus baekrokdamisoli TaxID=1712516 RepID=A0A3G9J2S2_9BACL|nr:hypothetical protein Back11_14660 [Paenibacillus baekrokdamisoli]
MKTWDLRKADLFTIFKANPDEKMAGKIDTMTSVKLYETGIDKWKASIAIKCIDHIPIPIAKAPPDNHM